MRPHQVVLHVRAYGQQGVEFALSGPKTNERRSKVVYWSIIILVLSSVITVSSIQWSISSSSSQFFIGFLLAAVAALIYYATGNAIVEEAMLVVPALGVRLSKRQRNGVVTSEFVDLDKICGVAVNEAITFSNVVYSLVLMVVGQCDMVLPFETFRPRVAVLQDIYQETKTLLFPNGSDREMCLPDNIAPRLC